MVSNIILNCNFTLHKNAYEAENGYKFGSMDQMGMAYLYFDLRLISKKYLNTNTKDAKYHRTGNLATGLSVITMLLSWNF